MKIVIEHEQTLIDKTAQTYGFDPTSIKKYEGGFQNLVYEYRVNDQAYVLRITDGAIRTYDQVKSEIDFLLYLTNAGVTVSSPIPSTNKNYISCLHINEKVYYSVAFEKAKGSHITYPGYLEDANIYYELGKLTGKMHLASRTFPKDQNKRHSWKDNDYLKKINQFIPDDEALKRKAILETIKATESLTVNDDYGLIHGDINVGNFFMDDKTITLFDFDECQNSWLVEDIAIQLFYTVYVYGDDSLKDRKAKAREFMQYFLKGYRLYQDIKSEQLHQIPHFLKLREIIVHVGIYKMWDLDNLGPWQSDYFEGASRRIIRQEPIVEFEPSWLNFIE